MDNINSRIQAIKQKLNPLKIENQIKEIEKASGSTDFWQNQSQATEKMKTLAQLQKELEEILELENLAEKGESNELNSKLNKLELKTYMSGSNDEDRAILSIHSGQGGVEAMDWASMLQRMYVRYFEKQGWPFEIVDETPGEEAGIKSVTYTVNIRFAYGYLKREAGTHRLVRQSPFNADKLRQTSFALVEVLPQIENPDEILIKEEELEWQFYRASGHGGQNVQKVSTAVRLKHLPSGIIVTCQTERFQEQNRKNALSLLRSKLWELEEKRKEEESRKLKGGRTKASWGTQIRNYVLHPYKLVKDTRTEVESNNPETVLDGELDEFISAELKSLEL